jgi:pimeloyl-ACP methyl ester carboxylesterase
MRPIRWLRRGVALVGLGVAGGAVLVTARHLLETPQPLQSGLPGEGRIDRKHGGDIYYSVLGPEQAEPLVLLHDFYPGASNYEFRHIFPRFAVDYRVFAPDWLGFGMSEHPPLAYTGEFYANMLTGFLKDVIGRPAHLIAHGRAANIATRVASDTPELVERLVLVSPYTRAGVELEPSIGQALARTAQRVSLGLVPYAVLSSRPLLSLSLRGRSPQTAQDGDRDDALGHLYASSHQFGGQHALGALLTGELDLPIQNAFALLEPPVLVVGGDHDPRHLPEEMEDLAILNPHADLEIITGAGDAAFEDQPAVFFEQTESWLQTRRLRHEPGGADFLPPFEADEEEAAAEAFAATEPEVVLVVEPTEADEAEQAEQLEDEEDLSDTPVEIVVIQPPEEDFVDDEAESAAEPASAEAFEAAAPDDGVTESQEPDEVAAPSDTASRETDAEMAETTVPILSEESAPANIGTESADEVADSAEEQPSVARTDRSRAETSSRQAPRQASARRGPTTSKATRKPSGAKARGTETRGSGASKKRSQRKTQS